MVLVFGYGAIAKGGVAMRFVNEAKGFNRVMRNRLFLHFGRIRLNAPDMLPVAVVGGLAVDRRYEGKGLGAVLVHAKD
jgi:hypothetical protein